MENDIQISKLELLKRIKKGYTEIAISKSEGKWRMGVTFPEQIKFLIAFFKQRKWLGNKVYTIQFPNYKLEGGEILFGNEIRQSYSEKDFEEYINDREIKIGNRKDLTSLILN